MKILARIFYSKKLVSTLVKNRTMGNLFYHNQFIRTRHNRRWLSLATMIWAKQGCGELVETNAAFI
jgi:hypothetical protein